VFDISESNIIEREETGGVFENEGQPQVRIVRNQADPTMIVDGVDGISVTCESTNRLYVEYWGYLAGGLWATRDGVSELKQNLLDDQDDIPGWSLSTDVDELPDWFPAPENPPSPVTCTECGSEVSGTKVVTPYSGELQDRYCPDCWVSVREDL
jgi:hypothetical protein